MSDTLGFFFLLMSNGVLIGLMYSLIALGFVLVYKATGRPSTSPRASS